MDCGSVAAAVVVQVANAMMGEIANRKASIHEFAATLARLADADAR